MKSVTEQGKGPKPRGRQLKLRIENEDDGERYSVKVDAGRLLSEAIDTFYAEELRRERRGDDRLRCERGEEDVFAFAELTFERYLGDGHCLKLEWLFAGGTGGA